MTFNIKKGCGTIETCFLQVFLTFLSRNLVKNRFFWYSWLSKENEEEEEETDAEKERRRMRREMKEKEEENEKRG